MTMLLTMAVPMAVAKNPKAPVDVQILGLNDFHGQLEPVDPTVTSGARIGSLTGGQCLAACIAAGGVEYLATHVANLKATNPNTVFVSAGDLIGATPLLSALFHDEPTIEAFNLMGLDYNGVGNHEFDEGVDELLRMAYGDEATKGYEPARPDGCHPVDGCGDGDGYGGADFDFLAANVAYKDSGKTIFAPYSIHNFPGGVKVAFVGMTLEGTPLIVSPGGISSVNFLDEAETVNALVPHLKRRGVEAIVVLLHEGGTVAAPGNGAGNIGTINSCTSPSGAIPQIAANLDPEIDIMITGHTNWAVHCRFGDLVVTGAASQGRLVTDIDAKIDRTTGDFVPGSITVNNHIVSRDVAQAPALTALIAKYKVFEGPISAVVVGNTTAAMDRSVLTAGRESTLGRLIADAQLASSQGAGAQIAFMNPGGIRSNFDAGDITHGEAFSVQPFSNIVTTMTLTGAQIDTILEQQFTVNSGPSAGNARTTVLLVSEGFTYTWDAAAPLGNRVDPATTMLNGVPLGASTEYRVTANNFLSSGGDDFPGFLAGTNIVTGADDLVALEAYLGSNNPYTPVETVRITRAN
ncbi:MAG: bifunctional metallophosphatase/5'-nucleotidase [Chloroflexi bacterium]|nr:bifunctional metallophosphatase/5'-nucleotidase [Chloroflexota bacterium]